MGCSNLLRLPFGTGGARMTPLIPIGSRPVSAVPANGTAGKNEATSPVHSCHPVPIQARWKMAEKKGTTAEGTTAGPKTRGRITARLSAEKQELLQLAADLSGSTLNQFIVQAALRAAAEVIEQEVAIRAISLNAEESRRFLALLEDPPQPNDNLKRAMERFRSSRIASADSSFEF